MKHLRRKNIWITTTLLLCLTVTVNAAPKADLWTLWEANNPASVQKTDHDAWDTFLSTYLSTGGKTGLNTLAYAQVSATDKSKLDEYIKSLERVQVASLDRTEQLAFWINLYNAGTVQVVLGRYPVASIREIKPGGLFSSGPWDERQFYLSSEKLSLNDIEHRILRQIWKDSRIHYTVNFGTGQAALISHFQSFAEPQLSAKLGAYTGKISYAYDWALNEGTKK